MTIEKFSRQGPQEPPKSGGKGSRLGRSLLVLSLAVSGILVACGPDSQKSKSDQAALQSQGQSMTPEEKARREQIAAQRYSETQKLPPDEKVIALSDVAQVYHDTDIGPLAYMDLVFYLSDHSVDKPEEAMKALKDFERRRPRATELLSAANVMHSVATTKFNAAEDEAQREAMARIRDGALEVYTETALRLVGTEIVADDGGAYHEIGNALILAGRFDEAEKALALVEDFKKPAEDSRRVAFLIRRGDIFRGPLKRNKEALELFLKARELQKGLGRASSPEQAQYVEDAIQSLRS